MSGAAILTEAILASNPLEPTQYHFDWTKWGSTNGNSLHANNTFVRVGVNWVVNQNLVNSTKVSSLMVYTRQYNHVLTSLTETIPYKTMRMSKIRSCQTGDLLTSDNQFVAYLRLRAAADEDDDK
ncbi:hypothetical protein YC2023_028448 [Brassica napus]